jgi:peptidoglycan-N-acetylglucosamine deacetylase
MGKNNTILITVDVEDWFQVENFKKHIPFSSWSGYNLRVERNTHNLLDLFDSMKMNTSNQQLSVGCQPKVTLNPITRIGSNTEGNPRATFFVLGWVAERLPHLVKEIYNRGHEVASHGYSHDLCNELGRDDLRKDLSDSKKLLEDIIGARIYGYRAPSFSINSDIIKMLEECGYLYDSSYNSFGMHSRYGHLNISDLKKIGIASKLSDKFYELPVSNLVFKNLLGHDRSKDCSNLKPTESRNSSNITNGGNLIIPWGGGGYFRLIPLPVFKKGIDSILKRDKAYLFYIHPWEIDPEQPRVKEASLFFRFRHYTNLKCCRSKLVDLIKSFPVSVFSTCHQYISGL